MDLSSVAKPEWANWAAQDADGAIWVYEVEPHQYHQGWYENEVGRSQKIKQLAKNRTWPETLTKIT